MNTTLVALNKDAEKDAALKKRERATLLKDMKAVRNVISLTKPLSLTTPDTFKNIKTKITLSWLPASAVSKPTSKANKKKMKEKLEAKKKLAASGGDKKKGSTEGGDTKKKKGKNKKRKGTPGTAWPMASSSKKKQKNNKGKASNGKGKK